jgi:rubrerythrin
MVRQRPKEAGLSNVLGIILDKGVVVDSKAKVCFSDVDLLATKSRIVLSSFETAKEVGLEFPENTNFDTQAWLDLSAKESCPVCGMNSTEKELREGCPWCGWTNKQDEE